MFRYIKSIVFVFCFTSFLSAATVEIKKQCATHNLIEMMVELTLEEGEYAYKEFLNFSTDHPDVSISDISIQPEAESHYVPSFHANKLIYKKNITISLMIQKTAGALKDTNIHMTYMTSHGKKTEEFLIPLQWTPDAVQQEESISTPKVEHTSLAAKSMHAISMWSQNLEKVIQTTELWWVRFLLIILLGLLMSLTPCIYPMIPITIGIMQSQGNKSMLSNFIHASAYSLGIAFTFALMGLLAVVSGTVFGSMLASPIVVLVIVAVLLYLAGSMFGFYEMYIPRFMQESGDRKHHGSALSSFVFGAMSGSIASPCLSPGLALVLTIVASLGSKFLGFMLLFAFGIGLSIPLLIIGTFSSSLNMLPRAGHWMLEVKKIFGFLLVGMSFYYLKNIMPYSVLLWLIASFAALSGIYYFYTIGAHETAFWKRTKNLLGTCFMIGSVLLYIKAYQYTFQAVPVVDTFWITDYATAVETHNHNHKYLFIDFWAPSCSICTAIEKIHFKDATVRQELSHFIPVKLELVMSDPTIAQLKEKFKIMGLPVIILYDVEKDIIIKRWGAELYQKSKQEFIKDLQSFK